MQRIYLDHAATTPLLPEVADAVRDASLAFPGNAGSQHAFGREARQRIATAAESALTLLGAEARGPRPDRLLLTSGGTEANNHALRGAVEAARRRGVVTPHLVVSAVEHPSVLATAAWLASGGELRGCRVDLLPVDKRGVARLEELDRMLRPETCLVSLMLANHETGVLQPVAEAASVCAARGVPLHTDATQAVGKAPVDFRGLGAALMTISPHKFRGPVGVGGLLVRGDPAAAGFPPLLQGQAGAPRPGTPSVALAVGLEAALGHATQGLAARAHRLERLRRRLERTLLDCDPGAVVVGGEAPRLPGTLCAALPGVDRQVFHMALDREGVACSTGSACASGSGTPSPVLLAMGVPQGVVAGGVRFSLGDATTEAEVLEAAVRISRVYRRLSPPHGA